MQESACIITGISYEGTDSSGKVNWAGLTNIHIIKYEQAIRFQVSTVGRILFAWFKDCVLVKSGQISNPIIGEGQPRTIL